MVATATIAGVPILPMGNIGWCLTPGVMPYQRTFIINRSDLDAIQATRGQDIELAISTEKDDLTVSGLSFLRASPAQHPQQVGILVSDGRWKWSYKWLMRRYNMVRRTGNKAIIDPSDDETLTVLQAFPDVLRYGPFSLTPSSNYTKAWDAIDVVRDVFDFVTDGIYSDNPDLYSEALEIQDLELDDDGASAIQRVLASVPGANVFLDTYGVAQIYSTLDGSEQDLLQTLGDRFVGSTLDEYVGMGAMRPKKIVVHFSCEDEVRFDYTDAPVTRSDDGRWMRNVMPLPVTLNLGGQRLAAGNWVEITDDLLTAFRDAYPAITPAGKVLPPLTLAVLRQIWCNGGYNRYMECLATTTGDPVYVSLLSALRTHYRQTFQVNQRWADRVIAFLPKRVALIDPVNNVWGQPMVWANYATLPSWRRIGRTDADPTLLAYNHTPFPSPATADQVTLASVWDQKAWAELRVVDPQLGIFHLNYFTDPQGETQGVVPSNMDGYDATIPGTSFVLPSAAVDAPLKVLSHCKLADTSAVSLVITVLTGAPNNLDQTWSEEVTKPEAQTVLANTVSTQITGEDFGPEMHVHVGSGLRTARFAWTDSYREDIENTLLGLQKDGRRAYAPSIMVNPEEIRDLAEAYAANIYSSMVNHHEGEPISVFDGSLQPQGRAGFIEHGLTTEGAFYSKVNLPAPRQGVDFWALLPDWTRRLIRRILPR